ncbi:MAG: CPBP family intramembrane metalloprotease [Myxococcales bacterium]
MGLAVETADAWLLYPLIQAAVPSFDPSLRALGLPAACAMLLVAIAGEETLFRGYGFLELGRRHGKVWAVAITTVLYAALAGGQGFPLVAWATGFGLVLCALREWRGSLWPGAIAHAIASLGPKIVAALFS